MFSTQRFRIPAALISLLAALLLAGCGGSSSGSSNGGDDSESVSGDGGGDDTTSGDEVAGGGGGDDTSSGGDTVGGDDPVASSDTGTFSLDLTDAPVDDATAVNVVFTGVELKPQGDGPPVTFTCEDEEMACGDDDALSVDLLQLTGGNSENLLEGAEIEAGTYNWLRLHVDAASPGPSTAGASTIEFEDGRVEPLTIPSGDTRGLQFNGDIVVEAEADNRYTLDVDLRRAIVRTGPPDHAGPPDDAGPGNNGGGPPDDAGPPDNGGGPPDHAGPPGDDDEANGEDETTIAENGDTENGDTENNGDVEEGNGEADEEEEVTLSPGGTRYMLRPALRLVRTESSANVSGEVAHDVADECTLDETGRPDGWAVYVFEGEDAELGSIGSDNEPVTTTNVSDEVNDNSNFEFTIGFLEPGTYTAALTCEAGADDSEEASDIGFTAQRGFELTEGEDVDGVNFGLGDGDQAIGEEDDEAIDEEEDEATNGEGDDEEADDGEEDEEEEANDDGEEDDAEDGEEEDAA